MRYVFELSGEWYCQEFYEETADPFIWPLLLLGCLVVPFVYFLRRVMIMLQTARTCFAYLSFIVEHDSFSRFLCSPHSFSSQEAVIGTS
jgi:hypothetical protein